MADTHTLADETDTDARPGAEARGQEAEPFPAGIDAVARALVELEQRFPPPDLDQVRADWQWVIAQTPTPAFDRYRGLTIAVFRGQVVGASDQPLHLQLELARRLKVHPEQLVMAHLEPSAFR